MGECITPSAFPPPFQFQRRSTASTVSSGETLHSDTCDSASTSTSPSTTHTRQQSRDSSYLFSAPSLDSSAETICGAPEQQDDDDEVDFVAALKLAALTGVVPASLVDHHPHRSSRDPDADAVESHRFARMLKRCSLHPAKLTRSIKSVCSFRFRDALPPPVVYAEPQYSLVGDIKTVRFDDCVGAPAAPCTDWDEVECQAVLVVGRDPTLPPLQSRSSIIGGFRESRYALNRLSQSFR